MGVKGEGHADGNHGNVTPCYINISVREPINQREGDAQGTSGNKLVLQ